MHPTIYEKLEQVASAQTLTTYGEIAPLASLNMGSQADRNEIAHILGAISRFEHEQGRPMLSVVVVRSETMIPGKGFFDLALELGLYSGGDELSALRFFASELDKVHTTWRAASE